MSKLLNEVIAVTGRPDKTNFTNNTMEHELTPCSQNEAQEKPIYIEFTGSLLCFKLTFTCCIMF